MKGNWFILGICLLFSSCNSVQTDLWEEVNISTQTTKKIEMNSTLTITSSGVKEKNPKENSWSLVSSGSWIVSSLSWTLTNFWIINNFDFLSDNSITKFVNNKVSFSDLKYIPENLVSIKSDYITDSKWNSTLRKEANEALQKMWKDFYETFWEKIIVVSAYRSYNYQVWIKSWGCADNFCAKAGFSEHQSWLAFDLWQTTNKETFLSNKKLEKYFVWLNENAYKYGFHNTYQKWVETDWYEEEPWHWRFLWVEFATILKKSWRTFAEYIWEKK